VDYLIRRYINNVKIVLICKSHEVAILIYLKVLNKFGLFYLHGWLIKVDLSNFLLDFVKERLETHIFPLLESLMNEQQ